MEEGHGYALLRRGPKDEVIAVAGPFEVDQDRTRTSWQLFVNAIDEDEWTRETKVVDWANVQGWGPALFVTEDLDEEGELLP